MALNTIGRIWIGSSNSLLFQNVPKMKQFKPIRNFRRNKRSVEIKEEAKVNPGSLETPFSNVYVGSADLSVNKLWKPFLFTIGFSGATFVGCAIWEYENMRCRAINALKRPVKFFKKNSEFAVERSNVIVREFRAWWNTLTPGQRVFVPICAVNILVFAAWRIPRLQPFMLHYFASNPASPNQCLPMILSTFSHYSLFHLMANMYVLHSFSTGAVHSLGKEQFVALYLSSGVISSFTSYFHKVLTKQPGLSLGASGSIMAVLGYVCTEYPDTRLGIILLPFLTFSAGSAIKVIVGLDTAGAILGWRFFDHAAHLGGVLTGIGWALWGNQNIWPKREPILKYWHELRGSVK